MKVIICMKTVLCKYRQSRLIYFVCEALRSKSNAVCICDEASMAEVEGVRGINQLFFFAAGLFLLLKFFDCKCLVDDFKWWIFLYNLMTGKRLIHCGFTSKIDFVIRRWHNLYEQVVSFFLLLVFKSVKCFDKSEISVTSLEMKFFIFWHMLYN